MSSDDAVSIEIIESNGGTPSAETYKRNTTSLELSPNEVEKAEIARNQLLNLTKKTTKKKPSPATSDSEVVIQKAKPEVIIPPAPPKQPVTEIIYDGKPTMSNLSSAIISKDELEDEIRKKMTTQSETRRSTASTTYDIEIPQELILSEVPEPSISKEVEQLGQDLIDILEGNGENESEMFEVIGENGMFIVKAADQQSTSFEIVSPDDELKKKMLERHIAMQQIASMPMRKNRRLKQFASTPKTAGGGNRQSAQTLAQSLAMDWSDKEEEVILEVENVEESSSEPKIKILNMTILNESAPESKVTKNEPKILNINAPTSSPPKILNKNAPSAKTEPASFKRGRVVKKKQIWDPSESPQAHSPEKKVEKVPLALPHSITIKKVTKETIARELPTAPPKPTAPASGRKGKKKSEIEKLFQDEGAVNMIYSLERQNNNQDVPELEIDNSEAFVDKTEEKSALIAKQKTIRETIIKQSTSPNETKVVSTRPQRVKRDLTPSKPVEPPKTEKTPEKTITVIKAQRTASAGRKKKIDDSWDYVRNAQTTCADAMIIRRHSNSSYSSSAPTSPRRLSVDQSLNDSAENFKMPKERKSTEMPKDLKSSVGGLVEELRNTLSTKLAKVKTPPARGRKRAAVVTPEATKRRALGSDKEYTMTKADGVAHIVVSTNSFNLSLLDGLKSILAQLEKDDSCKVVLFTSSEDFSKGLDYSSLLQNTVDKRKQAASDLVTAVKNFFISLAAFKKTTVCGLKELTSGLGVTMLPLFDVVVADQNAKFSLPHVQIGCNPEGISILQASDKVSSSVITQLFFLHETLDAKTALQSGLISKIVTGNINTQLKEICKQISLHSSQALESTKELLTEDFLNTIDQRLSREMKILQQQWIGAECQEKFKKFSASGEW